jgi:hypothetical protein
MSTRHAEPIVFFGWCRLSYNDWDNGKVPHETGCEAATSELGAVFARKFLDHGAGLPSPNTGYGPGWAQAGITADHCWYVDSRRATAHSD